MRPRREPCLMGYPLVCSGQNASSVRRFALGVDDHAMESRPSPILLPNAKGCGLSTAWLQVPALVIYVGEPWIVKIPGDVTRCSRK